MQEKESKKIFSPVRGRIIIVITILLLAGGAYIWYNNRSYSGYEVQERIDRGTAESANFLEFGGKLLSYSRDGASYTDFDGDPVWNESFDMESPEADICEGYCMIYDKQRTVIEVFSEEGPSGRLTMTLPIVRAAVSATGKVAVLMQDDDTAYIRLYDISGKIIASGEVHANNTGYPMAIDISPDSKHMMVSLLDLNNGDVKTTICFYDFSKSGKNVKDHMSANYSYADLVIPDVRFMGEEAIAFGDNQLIFYSVGKDIKSKKEVFLEEELKAVFGSEDSVGIITSEENEEDSNSVLRVFSTKGQQRFLEHIPSQAVSAKFMSNGEIFLRYGNRINLYAADGNLKLDTGVEEALRTVIPWDGQRNYYFITRNATEKVVLK